MTDEYHAPTITIGTPERRFFMYPGLPHVVQIVSFKPDGTIEDSEMTDAEKTYVEIRKLLGGEKHLEEIKKMAEQGVILARQINDNTTLRINMGYAPPAPPDKRISRTNLAMLFS
jgi:hypothetical protein